MDQEGVLDLRCGGKKTLKSLELSPHLSEPANALDLRTSKNKNEVDRIGISKVGIYVKCPRPSVIRQNLQFTPNTLSQRSRWNHRSHPSIDSDSSFESEYESEYSHSGMLLSQRICDTIDSPRCSSNKRVDKRESISYTDTENDSETCESSSTLSMGFYKELPTLTANVSIGQERRNSMVLELPSCQAEIIDPEDVRSELKNNMHRDNYMKGGDDDDDDDDDDDELNANSFKITETESYLRELLQMQTEQNDNASKLTTSISAGIQETATKYIKEIRKTKSDMHSSGLNLEVDGKKKQQCIKCKEEFYSVAALLNHLMTHSSRNPGEKLIKCPVCTKRFSTLTTLEKHIERLHTGLMKYTCQMCEAPFKFSTHLRKHMVTSRCGKGTKKNN